LLVAAVVAAVQAEQPMVVREAELEAIALARELLVVARLLNQNLI
jgi:hypothetical protein